jgi:hypothetical protein
MQSFFSGLFGGGGGGGSSLSALVLRPDASGRTVNGFHGGADLRVSADYMGQSVGELLEKFNVYRSPDQQIVRVWGLSGAEIPHSSKVVGNTIAFVRAESIVNK